MLFSLQRMGFCSLVKPTVLQDPESTLLPCEAWGPHSQADFLKIIWNPAVVLGHALSLLTA